MSTKTLDCKGLPCPQPTLKMSIEIMTKMQPGEILEVVADCATFESDVKSWCSRMNKTLLWFRDEGNGQKRCQIRA